MKLLAITLAVASIAMGSIVSQQPVAMYGAGSFELTTDDGGDVSMWATSINNTVYFNITTDWLGFMLTPGSTAHPFLEYSTGWAEIGGLSSRYFDLVLNPGPGIMGSLTLFDGVNGNEIAEVSINAKQVVTGREDSYMGSRLYSSTGTMQVVPNPEPGTGMLILSAMAVLGIVFVYRSVRPWLKKR